MTTVVGVDGCKIGWFYFRRDKASISHHVASDLKDLTKSLPSQSRVFIDIPIGLHDAGPEGRECDTLARRLLGRPRASSIFSAPVFPVLTALTFEDAKRKSFNASGKFISRQTFAITPKIHEVNDFLAGNSDLDISVREIHPELCFWALWGQNSMNHTKKKTAGFYERLKVLSRFLPDVDEIIEGPLQEYKRSEVAKDDILDALVALIVASTSEDKLKTLPPVPPIDSRGLPMEMVYTEEPNNNAL